MSTKKELQENLDYANDCLANANNADVAAHWTAVARSYQQQLDELAGTDKKKPPPTAAA